MQMTKPCEQCGEPVTRRVSKFKGRVYCSQACCNAWRSGRSRPEHGEKVRRALKGRKPSPQCYEALSKVNSERLRNPEIQAKMQAALAEKRQGSDWSAEYGKRISAGLNRYYETHRGPNLGRACPWVKGFGFGDENPNWRGGVSETPYPPEWTRGLREIIRNRDGWRCTACGASKYEAGCELDVHHIDFDKSNCEPDNLTTLCRSCHRKVPDLR